MRYSFEMLKGCRVLSVSTGTTKTSEAIGVPTIRSNRSTANKTGTGSRCFPVWLGYWEHARVPVPLLLGPLGAVVWRRVGNNVRRSDSHAMARRLHF